ncbi:glycosyltransferase [Candidatus Woesearchaeota archaeon CG_4_10_14_0_2_um_filter_33_13]|nr:MAG: glycosyltransferase [Candidatus Woesearchaeota archaeon CG_4_10_14_0_2_um_filter_33_13]
MKIVLFGLNGRGGMLHYTSQYANALSKKVDVYVILPSYSDTSLFDSSVKLIKINAPLSVVRTLFSSINIIQHLQLIRTINELNPSIVQFMDNHPWYLPYVYMLKRYKIFVTQHDPQLHSGEARGIRSFLISITNKVLRNKADRVIVHGEGLKKVLLKYGVSDRKILVVPHGDYSFFTKYSLPNIRTEPYTILQFGRIVKYKGVDTLLKAIPLVKKKIPLIKVIIAGEGDFSPYRQYLTKDIKENVKIINRYVPDEEVAELFQKCSFVVLPYDDATQSGPLHVAYSFKKPVIVTDVGCLPEVVDDGKTGLIIKPKDPEILAEAIISMFHKDLKAMGENGYIKMKELMNWDKIADIILVSLKRL